MKIGLGAKQMADEVYTRGWGLGRHVLGSNYFHYIRDPWGRIGRSLVCTPVRMSSLSNYGGPEECGDTAACNIVFKS